MSRTCDSCGAFVSQDYFRVFADNNGVLHGCHNCQRVTAPKNPHEQEEAL